MKKIFLLWIGLMLLTAGCSSNAGVDPHLTQEEILELQLMHVNTIVGKWNIRRDSKSFAYTNNCQLVSIEFTEEGKYILKLSYDDTDGPEEVYFRGLYFIVFNSDSTTEVAVDRVLLMNDDYTQESTLPATGQIATLTNISIESDTGIAFDLSLGSATDAVCNTQNPLSIQAAKEAEIAPDAPEGSNGQLLLREWRLIDLTVTVPSETEGSSVYCQFLADQFAYYCLEENGESSTETCVQPYTLTFTFTGYGTYLVTVFDIDLNPIDYIEGQWRWQADSSAYDRFEVIDTGIDWADATQEDIQELSIHTLSEDLFQVDEQSALDAPDGSEVSVLLRYFFQTADQPIPANSCGDLNDYLEE